MNETIKIPIVINNTWNDTLLGITLEATTNVTKSVYILTGFISPNLTREKR